MNSTEPTGYTDENANLVREKVFGGSSTLTYEFMYISVNFNVQFDLDNALAYYYQNYAVLLATTNWYGC